MAFDWAGSAGGAIAGASLGPVGMIGGGILGGLFGAKKKTTSLRDMRTPEQKQAAALLQSLATTGSGGGINLGQAYGGSLGNFDLTGGEQGAYNQLAGLFGGQDINKARETFTNLADTKFDPSDPTSGYAAYSRELAKAQKESSDSLNQEAAISGSRFGTGILENKRQLADTFANQRAMKLAELFQNSRSQQMAGAQGLQGLVGTQANLANQQAAMAGLQRELKNQEAQANYSEWNRQRGETLSRIDLLNQEASRNPYLGIPSITTNEQSPFSSLVGSVLGSYGSTLGENMAGGRSNGLKGLFSKYFGKTTNGSSGNILNVAKDYGIGF